MAEGDPGFRRRLVSAFALIALALSMVAAGGVGFAILIAIFVALLAFEWGRMSEARYGATPGRFAGVAVLIVGLAGSALVTLGALKAAIVCVIGGAVLAGVAAPAFGAPAIWTGAGVAYVGTPALALIWLRLGLDSGLVILTWLLVVVWTADSAAYFCGRGVGGPRLAPSISPAKTWSGFAGGIFGAALVGLLVANVAGSPRLAEAALLGALVGIATQLGDLAESTLKRRAGVKDSGSLIPGHGGVFDRVDGLMFAAPSLALFCLLIEPRVWPWP